MSDTSVIVLAAGQGTRMKSRRAKVLHALCGLPMLEHVLRSASALDPARLIVVVGRDAEEVERSFAGRAEFVLQAEQKGTGHAVRVAEPTLGDASGDVLVLYGDTPLLTPETLERMSKVKAERGAALAVLTARTKNIPGRVQRDAQGRAAEAQEGGRPQSREEEGPEDRKEEEVRREAHEEEGREREEAPQGHRQAPNPNPPRRIEEASADQTIEVAPRRSRADLETSNSAEAAISDANQGGKRRRAPARRAFPTQSGARERGRE